MHVYILKLHQEKDGDYLQVRRFIAGILSCNILDKCSQQIVKKVEPE